MSASSSPSVLITSGSGFTAFYCARELINQKLKVTVITPNPDEAEDIKKLGAEVRKVEPNDTETLKSELKKVDSVLMIPPASKDKLQVAKMTIDACSSAGVKNVIAVSTFGGITDKKLPELQKFKQIEDHALAKDIPNLCIIRANFYIQNLLLYKQQLQEKHELPAPTGNGKFAPCNLRDLGRICAHILKNPTMESRHKHQVYSLTGGVSQTVAQMCQEASKVLGVEINYKDISKEEAKNILSSIEWLDSSEAEMLLETYDLVKQNRLDMVSHDFEQLMGSEPTPSLQFWKENKDQLIKH